VRAFLRSAYSGPGRIKDSEAPFFPAKLTIYPPRPQRHSRAK